MKKYNLALKNYEKALELDDKYKEAYGGRGDLYLEIEEYEKALENYKKVLKIDSGMTEVYNNIGVIYFNQKQYSNALEEFNKSIEFGNKISYLNRGYLYITQNDTIKALKDFKTMVLETPDSKIALSTLGKTLLELIQNEKNNHKIEEYIECFIEHRCYYMFSSLKK